MNVESKTISTASTTDGTKSSSSSSSASKDSSATFKAELDAAKTQDAKIAETTETETAAATKKTSEQNAAQQVEKDKLTKEKNELPDTVESSAITDPLKALNAKIAVLSHLKGGVDSKIQSIESKAEEKTDKLNYCQTMKMDSNDVTFFVNLVENRQMTAQNSPGVNLNGSTPFTEIKSEATQATVQISATLLDAMNQSMKTNKPFRIDFDNNIAVVMKVDKDGVLSANFIPGSAAVEQYLRNNIAGLRQNFEEQNLPYNELSYSNQRKQDQNEKQSKNNKENENE